MNRSQRMELELRGSMDDGGRVPQKNSESEERHSCTCDRWGL